MKKYYLVAFNIYSHNRDDHSKNFSWLMDDSGKWSLAPAYDLTYSSTAIDEHSTTVDGEGANPGRKNIISLAKQFSISKPEELIEEVQESIAQWPEIAKESGVSTDSINRIQNSSLRESISAIMSISKAERKLLYLHYNLYYVK